MNIALLGCKRSGKDTFGEVACREFGYTRMAFADDLKKIARMLYPEEFENGNKPVELLQWFGQVARSRNPEVWINRLNRKIQMMEFANSCSINDLNIVVTDVRQQNEVDYLKSKGFYLVRLAVDREVLIDRCKNTEAGFTVSQLDHSTEQLATHDIPEVDFTLYNNGSLEYYKRNVSDLIKMINRKDKNGK